MNEFNEYVRDIFSEYGEIVIKSMMTGTGQRSRRRLLN